MCSSKTKNTSTTVSCPQWKLTLSIPVTRGLNTTTYENHELIIRHSSDHGDTYNQFNGIYTTQIVGQKR